MGNDITAVALPFLIGQAEEILFRLQGDASARRWLDEAHLDPAAMERRIAALLDEAWEVATLPQFLGGRLKRISGDRARLLDRADAWRASMRQALGAAERHQELPGAGREGLDATRQRIQRGRLGVPGWRDMVRLVLAELQRVPCELGWQVDRAVKRGGDLLADLDALDEEYRATLRRRSGATEAARRRRAALRKLIRSVAADWSIAMEVSGGELAPLDLGLLRGARGTAAAKRARRGAREAEQAEQAEQAEAGEVGAEVDEATDADREVASEGVGGADEEVGSDDEGVVGDEGAIGASADQEAAGAGGEADGCVVEVVPPDPAEAVAEGRSPAPSGRGARRRRSGRRARGGVAADRGAAPAGGGGAG